MSNPITWQQHYGRIVAAMPGIGRHQDQLEAFAASIGDAIANGTVMGGEPTAEELVRQARMNRAASYAGRRRLRFLMALADHGIQDAFEFGADYDEPLLVCDATTLREFYRRDFTQKHTVMRSLLTSDDMLLMERFETRKRVNMDDLNDKTAPLLRVIAAKARGYRTIPDAYRAGAFAVSHPPVSVRP